MQLLLLAARFGLGILFLWSGAAKLGDMIGFADAIRHYQIVGDPLPALLAVWLPWVEIFTGIWLLWKNLARSGAMMAAASLAIFTAAIALSWARGLDISCGCFGGSGATNYPVKIASNLVLLALAGLIVWKNPTSGTKNRELPDQTILPTG